MKAVKLTKKDGTTTIVPPYAVDTSKLKNLGGDIADDYDSTSAYDVGDFCLYNYKLYKCTTAIAEGGEEWNSDHWSFSQISEENKEISLKINTCSTDIGSKAELKTDAKTDLVSAINEIKESEGGVEVDGTTIVKDETTSVISLATSLQTSISRADEIYEDYILAQEDL